MNADFIAMIEYLERERGISRDVLIDSVQKALLAAARKSVEAGRDLRIIIDRDSGDINAIARLIVVEKVENKHDEIALSAAKKIKADVQLGEEIDVNVTPKDLGRIAAQNARQTIMQAIRIAEKAQIYEEFKDRAGEIVTGTVRRFERSDVIVDLGKFEGTMPNKERVATEEYNIGDRIRAYVVAVENGNRGPEIILSRSHPNFVRRLFETEVNEIADKTVLIRSIARDAGYRTKLAVYSENEKVDPVGACVGMKGARVKNIVRELNNEKVDIIRWTSDMKEFISEALKPAKIRAISLDESRKAAYVKVDEDQLSLAIGKRGQNVRLTHKLTGWEVNIERDQTAKQAFEDNVTKGTGSLASTLGVDEATARTLITSGMNSVDVIASCETDDIIGVLGCQPALAQQILEAARAATASA